MRCRASMCENRRETSETDVDPQGLAFFGDDLFWELRMARAPACACWPVRNGHFWCGFALRFFDWHEHTTVLGLVSGDLVCLRNGLLTLLS